MMRRARSARGASSTPTPTVRVIVNTGERATRSRPVSTSRSSAATARRCASSRAARSDAELRLTAWHNRVRKPVIAAVNGVCAGGGLHFVADADIVIAAVDATFLDPHVSVGQVTRVRDDRPRRGSRRWRPILRMALIGRARAHRPPRGAYQLGILSAGRRSARAAARRGPGARREDRPELAGGDGAPPSGPCGARSSWASPTPAGPGPASSWRCGATPTRTKARWPSPRSASPLAALDRRRRP